MEFCEAMAGPVVTDFKSVIGSDVVNGLAVIGPRLGKVGLAEPSARPALGRSAPRGNGPFEMPRGNEVMVCFLFLKRRRRRRRRRRSAMANSCYVSKQMTRTIHVIDFDI